MKKTLKSGFLFLLFQIFFAFGSNSQQISVMSFNVRLNVSSDGDHAWPKRTMMVKKVLDKYHPEILGTQEVLPDQLMDLKKILPGYQQIGVGRQDGKSLGEYCAMFIDTARFHIIRRGDFGLSEKPDKIGLKGWDAACERIVTWAILRDRINDIKLAVFNTHYDHIGVVARRESSKLILSRMKKLAPDLPVILLGDFNSTLESEPLQLLLKNGKLKDAKALADFTSGPDNSFQDFGRTPLNERKLIDHVFCTHEFDVSTYQVIDDADPVLPSDHYPVQVVLSLNSGGDKLINNNWNFRSGENSDWENVQLPHTWNTDAYAILKYRRGDGWYQKHLHFSVKDLEKEQYIRFEGVNSRVSLYCNGEFAGAHAGGYTSFQFRLNKFLHPGSNEIKILVNNENDNIPPLSADFTMFGGIYRDVKLLSRSTTHFSLRDAGSEGIYVSTPEADNEKATVKIKTLIDGLENADNPKLIIKVSDPSGKTVAIMSRKLLSNKDSVFMSDLEISKPFLWSPEHPELYSMDITLQTRNQILDSKTISFGIRTFRLKGKELILNGKPLKLIGVNRHQDQFPFGIAVPKEVHIRDMKMIKDMGANFVRLAHYPQDTEVLNLCDQLGIVVWEEIPVVNYISLDDEFTRNCELALDEMVKQHYNHPSVFLWGFMNEIYLNVEYRSGEIGKYKKEDLLKSTPLLARHLNSRLKKLDPNRISTIAFHGSEYYEKQNMTGITDVEGWNLYHGWYGEGLDGFEKFIAQRLQKSKPILISEYGAGSDRRLQSLNPERFDFSMQWQQKYLEHYLPVLLDNDSVLGSAEWNFIDFNVGERQETMPRTNNKGLVYNDRTPKDVYFYYQAMLRKDIPVMHIASRDWPVRTEISATDKVIHPVKIYSNLDNITLSVNGVKQISEVKNGVAVFQAELRNGKNLLIADGNGKSGFATDLVQIELKIIPADLKQLRAPFEIAVNAGSNCHFIDDKTGIDWLPDLIIKEQPDTMENFGGLVSGKEFRLDGVRRGTTSEIAGTWQTPLYQTMCLNPVYCFKLPNGRYRVELGFAQIQKSNIDVFNIQINDQLVERNFSPAELAGANTALIRNFDTKVVDNKLTIKFPVIKGDSYLNALKIIKTE